MSELFETLPARQRRAVIALLTFPTVEAAAREARIGRTCLHRWLNDPLFVGALKEAQQAQTTEALAYLRSNLLKAVKKLSELLDSQSETIAHKAAVSLLEHGIKSLELVDVTQRVERLEGLLKN